MGTMTIRQEPNKKASFAATDQAADRRWQLWGKTTWIWVLILGLVVGLWVLETKTAPRLVHGPMVQLVRQNEFTLVWGCRPYRPGELVVHYSGGATKKVMVQRNAVGYQATVTGLPASAAIRYEIAHRSLLGRRCVLANQRTRTAKRTGEPLLFLVFGDSGSGGNAQRQQADLMAGFEADLVLHAGDLVYQAGHPADYPANFYQPNAKIIRSAPFYPVLGNHDVITENGRPLLDRFVLPENGPSGVEPERNFSFEFGDALFVGVDSNASREMLAEQIAPWLKKVLASSEAGWKFVFFHHPPYTGSKHSPDEKMQQTIVPVLEQTGVDIVFAGHNHLYERTAPILQGKISPKRGIRYVITGAGGMSKYPERADAPEYIVTYNDQVFSFTSVDVAGNQLRLRQISQLGQILDEWMLTKPKQDAP